MGCVGTKKDGYGQAGKDKTVTPPSTAFSTVPQTKSVYTSDIRSNGEKLNSVPLDNAGYKPLKDFLNVKSDDRPGRDENYTQETATTNPAPALGTKYSLSFDLDGPNGVSQQAMIYTFNYDNFLTHNMNDLRANNIKNPANASIAPASGTQNTSSAMPAPTTTANLTVPKPVPAR